MMIYPAGQSLQGEVSDFILQGESSSSKQGQIVHDRWLEALNRLQQTLSSRNWKVFLYMYLMLGRVTPKSRESLFRVGFQGSNFVIWLGGADGRVPPDLA